MKTNRVTRFLRVLIHIWWYLTLAGVLFIGVIFTGYHLGIFEGAKSIEFGIGWEFEGIEPDDDFLISVTDRAGNQYPVYDLKGEGELSFEVGELGMRKLSVPFYVMTLSIFGIGLYSIFLLRKLFDNLAMGNYFDELNALRIRHMAYASFAFAGSFLMAQILFESMFSIQTGSNIQISGVEIGLNPTIIFGLFLLALSEVFREGARLKADQDLTI